MRPECQNEFDRVVDITSAFEFHHIPYAVWGTMIQFINGIPVDVPVGTKTYFDFAPTNSLHNFVQEVSLVVEDDRFDDAVKIFLHDDYAQQCLSKPLPQDRAYSEDDPFDHFGAYAAGEAHFVDRDCSTSPVQLWRRSVWFPYADLLSDTYTQSYYPSHEEQVLKMQGGDEYYLLHGITCDRPRAFRVMTQAQMVESTMLHGAKALESNQILSITWARIFLHSLLYIGDANGKFHHEALHSL